ncbi:B-cell receptor CD22-like [Centropristis striata]|uniref:B-cell receptor CD22-like n=1 Tax=Centropristis striata TaxID=184440 RepID=UPI0027E190CA|nr:B-cell receptor CD22-like [Centropristis striata]
MYVGEPVDLTTDSEYKGRVQSSCSNNICTLRISDLRKSDADVYKFRFFTNQPGGKYTGSPGVTLTVTGVYGKNCNRLTYTDKRICASKGSSVKISCTYNKYNYGDASTFWFRKSPLQPENLVVNSQYAGRAEVETVRGRSTLTISELTESDSAEYHFIFKTPSSEWSSSPGTTLTVTELQVQVIRVYQSFTDLKCHSSCSPAGRSSFIWFKNGEKFREGETISYSGWFNSRDDVSCALKGHEEFPSPPVYAPRLPSVSVSPSAEIVEGSSVTLTCSSDANPAANITWYKENEDSAKASGQIFTITDFRAEHSGNYYCEAQNSRGRHNSTLHLTVAAVAGWMKSVAAGSLTAIFLALIFLAVFLLIRRKRSQQTTNQRERPDNKAQLDDYPVYENRPNAAAQREDTEEQEDLV